MRATVEGLPVQVFGGIGAAPIPCPYKRMKQPCEAGNLSLIVTNGRRHRTHIQQIASLQMTVTAFSKPVF